MAKKYENKVIVTRQEYDKAISAILGDKDPENCTSAVEIYAMFTKIAKCITDSSCYDEMNMVDSAKLDDSIACISNVLKNMIGDETLTHAIMSHLETLDDESSYDGKNNTVVDEKDDASNDESSEESKEVSIDIEVDDIENDDSLDVEPIDLIEVWDSCHTTDFNDFDGYASLVFIGRKHGFNHAYITEQLLYIMHNYNIGCNKIHYVGAAITANGVQKAFGMLPKAGDLVYFAYCKRPMFVMYASTPMQQWYIIYQCDKDTGTILGVYNKSDLDSVCDALCDVEVDNTAFSYGFDDLKKFCNEHIIDFNLIYRKTMECYVQEAGNDIDHVSNINFDIANKFYTKAGCKRYAEEHGSNGDLFVITTKPNNKSNKKNSQMIFALVCGSHSDGSKKIFQVDAIEIANHDETYVSSQPTKPKDDFDNDSSNSDEPISSQLAMNRDINGGVKVLGELDNGSTLANDAAKLSEDAADDGADDDDDIDVSSMRYMTNVDIKRKMDEDRAKFIKNMKQSQRWNSTTRRVRRKSSDTNTKTPNTKTPNDDNNSDEKIWSLDTTE